jgi:hypothetical protein
MTASLAAGNMPVTVETPVARRLAAEELDKLGVLAGDRWLLQFIEEGRRQRRRSGPDGREGVAAARHCRLSTATTAATAATGLSTGAPVS